MAGEKPRQRLGQSHTASLGRGGGTGREEVKAPGVLGSVLKGLGAQQIQPTEAPKRAVSQRGHPGSLSSRRDGPSGWEQSVPKTVPSSSPPLLWPPGQLSCPSAQSNRPSASLLHPVLPTPGLQAEVRKLSPHSLPPQTPEKANQGDSLTPPLSGSLLRRPTESGPRGQGSTGQTPPQPTAGPHSPAHASCPAGPAGPGRAGGTCSSGGP